MKKIIFALSMFLIAFISNAQNKDTEKETDPVILKRLEEWQDLKFGLMVTWGPYSQWGVTESWTLCPEDEPWCQRKLEHGSSYFEYKKNYENLKNTFNPINFNPELWAKATKNAGMKYAVLMTKHHDGFCMFDTKTTDYKVTDKNCPFSTNYKADLIKEQFNAFRNEGFMIGAYFSKPDWHSENYWWSHFPPKDRNVNYDIKKYPERWKNFMDYTYKQINEITSQYGKVDILWLDGGQVCPANKQDIDMGKIAAMARKNSPGLIMVDRCNTGKYENYTTPEQEIPDKALNFPWETCMTMGTSWSYVPNDAYKPTIKLIHNLVDIVSKGGSYLLNIGADPQGEFDPVAYQRLSEIGDWMKLNSEAIFKTRAIAPYKSGKVCFTSLADGTVYAIYLADENEKMPEKLLVDGIKPAKGAKINLLGSTKQFKFNITEKGTEIYIPQNIRETSSLKYTWVFKISKIEK